jgi:hypothetical protein
MAARTLAPDHCLPLYAIAVLKSGEPEKVVWLRQTERKQTLTVPGAYCRADPA